MDALRSVLPAGTLSGAPKVRAMQIIDELEPVKRGGYGGAVGYLSYAGDLDTCIHIRTVVVKDGVAHVQAGGGTVADAKPDYEYGESVAKAEAVDARRSRSPPSNRIGHEPWTSSSSTTTTRSPTTSSSTSASWARRATSCATTARTSTSCSHAPDRRRRLARPLHAQRGRHLARGRAPLPRGGDPDARRVPRPPVDRAGLRRARRAPRAGARQGDDDRARRRARSSPAWRSPLTVGRYHSLVVDEELPDCLEETAPRRRRADGHPPPRAARRGRAVPPRVRTHAARQAAPGQLPAAGRPAGAPN